MQTVCCFTEGDASSSSVLWYLRSSNVNKLSRRALLEVTVNVEETSYDKEFDVIVRLVSAQALTSLKTHEFKQGMMESR